MVEELIQAGASAPLTQATIGNAAIGAIASWIIADAFKASKLVRIAVLFAMAGFVITAIYRDDLANVVLATWIQLFYNGTATGLTMGVPARWAYRHALSSRRDGQ
jgi:hypothetical protein